LPGPEPAKVWTPPPAIDGSSIIERATRYVMKIPGAVSGQRGHDATFHVACVLVEGFNLSVIDALPIMRAWNKTCSPEWREQDLVHKLESADAKAEQRGYMLTGSHIHSTNGINITGLVLAGRL